MSKESRKETSSLLSERIRARLEKHASEEAAVEQRLSALDQCGPDALKRLAEVAEGYSGQSHHCRRILLALYNCSGSLKPDTHLGGIVATKVEVIHGQTTSFLFY